MSNKIKARIPRTSWGGDENLAERAKEQDLRLIPGDQATLEPVRGCVQLFSPKQGNG